MPTPPDVRPDTYDSLLEVLREIAADDRVFGRQERGRRQARTYWEMGHALDLHLSANQGRPRYGDQVILRLSQDLGMDQSLVYLMLRFRRALPNVDTYPKLAWSHYRLLVPLDGQSRREFYERAAAESRWPVRELQRQIHGDLYARALEVGSAAYRQVLSPAPPLRPAFGPLGTYKMVAALPGQTSWKGLVVDLGFYIHYPERPAGLDDPRPGAIVAAAPATGGGYRFAPTSRRKPGYTYSALVERVIDGDTLIARIDCGLGRWVVHKLRLRGIDAPELYSRKGRQARTFVTGALAAAPAIAIATHQLDPYGRYLADLAYLPGEADPQAIIDRGTYLNRQLLDEDLARPYA